MNELVEGIKQAAMDVYESMSPTEAMFGTVVSTSPLQINVEQKMVLGAAQLVLTRNVTDYTVDMTVSHTTENALGTVVHTHEFNGTVTDNSGKTEEGGEDDHTHIYEHGHTVEGSISNHSENFTHLHSYAGRKSFKVHNGLAAGEKVILLRAQQGQKFIVWDRVG